MLRDIGEKVSKDNSIESREKGSNKEGKIITDHFWKERGRR